MSRWVDQDKFNAWNEKRKAAAEKKKVRVSEPSLRPLSDKQKLFLINNGYSKQTIAQMTNEHAIKLIGRLIEVKKKNRR